MHDAFVNNIEARPSVEVKKEPKKFTLKEIFNFFFNSRRNHHYHSQRSARSNIDMGNYHQYSGVSPVTGNDHKYQHQQFQLKTQQSLLNRPIRPTSSFYEYETINPNGNYRKIGDHFNPLQNSNSSCKNVSGSSSVRITGNVVRAQISDSNQQQQQRGPFITQVESHLN